MEYLKALFRATGSISIELVSKQEIYPVSGYPFPERISAIKIGESWKGIYYDPERKTFHYQEEVVGFPGKKYKFVITEKKLNYLPEKLKELLKQVAIENKPLTIMNDLRNIFFKQMKR